MSDNNVQPKLVRRKPVNDNAFISTDLHPVLKRVYANRHIISADDVTYTLDQLLDYHALKDIDRAAGLVTDAVMSGQRILVIGDFDADGATSSALVIRSLRLMGHTNNHYLVPNRFEYGYGLTPEIVECATELRPDVIITVDNGISSLEGVALARQKGIKVVITDHHLAGAEIPDADAIVNPNQPDCPFPSKVIAGVGVAFYLMLATRATLREKNWFNKTRPEPNMACLLDLVALGTVADVVPLDKNNRVLVEQGLQRVRRNQCCPGIRALLNTCAKNYRTCTTQDFGFYAAPRLNAAGRLDDMSAGIECLITDDYDRAVDIAAQLHELNQQRKNIEGDMLQQANEALEQQLKEIESKPLPTGVCLYNEHWHQGVVGLLASRIKQSLHLPVIAFADGDSDELKGSARSIPGLHIRDVLDSVATRHPGMIIKFGGHAMAAGLSIKKNSLDTFAQYFNEEVERIVSEQMLDKIIETDGMVPPEEMTLETAEVIRYGGPWGQHFPEPVFDDEFGIVEWRVVGDKHLKMQLKQPGCDATLDAIAFNTVAEQLPAGKDSMRMAYRLDINEFRGRRNLQLVVEHIETD